MKQLFIFLILAASLNSIAVAQFKPGHYYKNDGTKVTGLIKLNYDGGILADKSDGNCTISYKSDKKGDVTKLTTNDICCFVIEKDSFTVLKNIKLRVLVKFPQDFAKVLQAGKINLYTYYYLIMIPTGPYGAMSTRVVSDLIIEKDGNKDKLSKKDFKELMVKYISDYPELLEKVNNKVLKFDESEQIIKDYNDFNRKK